MSAAAVTKRTKVRDWLARYGPAEVVGTLTAVAGSFVTFHLTSNELAAAYGGVIGENCGFYGTLIVREVLADRRVARAEGRTYDRRAVMRTIARLLVEFGPAELLDSLVLRPLAMGLATRILGRGVGVIVGKLLADVTFYLPVIATYEIRRARARRQADPLPKQ